MSRTSVFISATLLVVGLVAGMSLAGASEEGAGDAPMAAPSLRAATLEAPNARAAAFVHPSGYFLRNKGFRTITHPGTGVYCLQLPRGMDPSTAVVLATPEFQLSPTYDIFVQWDWMAPSCGMTRGIEIRTFSGGGVPANEAFTVLVP